MQDSDEGFTLIELLVVVVVIGVLAAMAIPAFLAQRTSAYVASATTDIRQMRIVLDSVYIETGSYVSLDGTTHASPLVAEQGYEGKATTSFIVSSTAGGYCVEGFDTRAPSVVLVARSADAGVARDPGGC